MSKQTPLLRSADVAEHFGSGAAVARAFTPPLSRAAVSQWGEFVPADRAHYLLSNTPGLYDLLVDQATGLTVKQMRERIAGEVAKG